MSVTGSCIAREKLSRWERLTKPAPADTKLLIITNITQTDVHVYAYKHRSVISSNVKSSSRTNTFTGGIFGGTLGFERSRNDDYDTGSYGPDFEEMRNQEMCGHGLGNGPLPAGAQSTFRISRSVVIKIVHPQSKSVYKYFKRKDMKELIILASYGVYGGSHTSASASLQPGEQIAAGATAACEEVLLSTYIWTSTLNYT